MRSLQIFTALSLLFVGFNKCSMESPIQTTDGGGIETIALQGTIFNETGDVSPNTKVMLMPNTFNPGEDILPDSMIDTTDSAGFFNLKIYDTTLVYNLEAVNNNTGMRLLISEIMPCQDTITVIDTLKKPGAINLELPALIDSVNGYVFIPGTGSYTGIAGNSTLDNKLVFDSLSAATACALYYMHQNTVHLLAESLSVTAGDTLFTVNVLLANVFNQDNSGLSSNSIYATQTDPEGNVWFGTYRGGLTKYDGQHWTGYTTINSGIPDNFVYSLALDNDGSIWAGTMGGMARFDGAMWTVYNTVNSSLLSDSVYVLTVDSKGVKWIGTDYGLSRFDGSVWKHYTAQNSNLPSNAVFAIAFDEDGYAWVGTNKGLAIFKDSEWTLFDTELPGPLVLAICIANDGAKWFGTNKGLARYKDAQWTTYTFNNSNRYDNYIRCINIDNKGYVWAGTQGNGTIMKFNGCKWSMYNNKDLKMPYIFERINDISFDNQGLVYIASMLDGVLVLKL